MSLGLPITRDTRRRDLVAADGQTVFTLDVPVFDLADVAVYNLHPATEQLFTQLTTGFTLSFVSAQPGPVQATFAVAPKPTSGDPAVTIRIEGHRVQERTSNATRNGVVQSAALEADFDKGASVLQELRRDIDTNLATALAVAAAVVLGQIPDGSLTYSKLAASAIASNAEMIAGLAANKVVTPALVKVLNNWRGHVSITDFLSSGTDLTAAFTSAKAYLGASGGKINVPAGNWVTAAETALPFGVEVDGVGSASVISPSAGMTALFNITAGNSGVKNLNLANISSRATSAIRVTKAADNFPVKITDNYIASFTNGALWSSGDRPLMSGNMFNSNTLAVRCNSDARNGNFFRNYVLGGNGFLFDNTAAQGPEGVFIAGNVILPGNNGAGAFCLQISAALEFDIVGNIFDQIVNGNGINVDATAHSCNRVRIIDNWIGRQAAAANALYGVLAVNGVRDLIVRGNTLVGWRQAGVWLFGAAGAHGIDNQVLDNVGYYVDPCVRDVETDYQDNVGISGNTFTGSTACVVENAGCTGRIDDNIWRGPLPGTINTGIKYGKQRAGMVLTNRGAATILSGTTNITFNHGLAYTPTAADLWAQVSGLGTNAVGEFYFDSFTSTQARLNCRNNPGISGQGFQWDADLTR